VPAATPQSIRKRLAAMLAATMRDRARIAEAERFDCHHRVLRRERSIDERRDQHIDGAEGLRPLRGGHGFEPRRSARRTRNRGAWMMGLCLDAIAASRSLTRRV
jgi:hypothetical protein